MGKIKLTQEQADSIQKLRDYEVSDFGIIANVVKNTGYPPELEKSIEVLRRYTHGNEGDNADRLLDALRFGYGVMPQYSTGDWVISLSKIAIGKIGHIHDNGLCIGKWYKAPGVIETMDCFTDKFSRHATDDEKKKGFWWSIGREVDEWKEGDVVSDFHNVLTSIDSLEIHDGEVGFPTHNDSDFRHVSISEIRLVTPVEQRLDK